MLRPALSSRRPQPHNYGVVQTPRATPEARAAIAKRSKPDDANWPLTFIEDALDEAVLHPIPSGESRNYGVD
jgi:hypothetical protein